MSSSNGHTMTRGRFRDADGRTYLLRVTRKQATRLAQGGTTVPVSVDANGRVTSIIGNGNARTLEGRLARFRLDIDPLPFTPCIPTDWEEILEQFEDDTPPYTPTLFYGSEGTGKDTLVKIIGQRIRERHGSENVAPMTIPSEERDGIVGHLETKASDFGDAVKWAKSAGKTVFIYLPEIESVFAAGDYCGSWEHQYKAKLRDTLDGTKDFKPDYLFAATNNLSRLGAPLLSRFRKHSLSMSIELAQGILRTHWPTELTNGLSSEHVLERLERETIAEATLTSRKKVALRASDLTAFNGRFLYHLAADIKRRIKTRRRKDAQFTLDDALVDELLVEHLQAIVAPVAEAAGTRAGVGEFLVKQLDRLDPPIVIEPKLDWCRNSRYLTS